MEVPRTYEDFKAVCQAIKDSGKTPLYEACQNGWHQVLPLFETGSYYVTLYDDLYDKLNKNEMKITEVTEIRTILGQMKECADLGYFGTDFLSQSVEGGVDAFGTEQAAMMYQSMDWIDEVINAYPEMDGKLGIFCLPWADNQSVSVNPTNNAYFININSKYVEECKEFLISWRDLKIFRKDLTAAESLLSAGLKLSPEKDRRLWNISIPFLKVQLCR